MVLTRIAAVSLIMWLTPTGTRGADLFQPASLADACQQAGAKQKLVFAFFVKDACEACHWMETNVFSDSRVAELLAKAISVRINTDKDAEAARKYDITEHPTLLFLKADGSVADRLNGGKDPQAFVRFAGGVLGGTDSLTTARNELAAKGEQDPFARHALARVLVQWHRYPEALENFLWCFDEGHRQPTLESERFRDVRRSVLISDITGLAERYPPAREALIRRRDAAREKVMAGTADREVTAEFAAINVKLGNEADNLAVYEQLGKAHPESSTLSYLRLRVFDTLLEQRRYAEINAAFDVTSDAQREFERFERYRQAANQMSSEQQASMRLGQLRTLTTQNVARCYEILLGVERTQDAAALAGRLLEFDKSADTYAALAAAAARAGKCTSEHLDYVRQALDLSGGNDPKIIGLAAQVYAQLGRRGEAIDLISGKLDAVKSEEGKRLLRGLLESLKAAPALTTQKGE